jgi:hypothetical protein
LKSDPVAIKAVKTGDRKKDKALQPAEKPAPMVLEDASNVQTQPVSSKAAKSVESVPAPLKLRLKAIGPDGKTAVFGGPGVPSPIPVKVGQSLPNGDTVVSIDLGAGKVKTTKQEFSIE